MRPGHAPQDAAVSGGAVTTWDRGGQLDDGLRFHCPCSQVLSEGRVPFSLFGLTLPGKSHPNEGPGFRRCVSVRDSLDAFLRCTRRLVFLLNHFFSSYESNMHTLGALWKMAYREPLETDGPKLAAPSP